MEKEQQYTTDEFVLFSKCVMSKNLANIQIPDRKKLVKYMIVKLNQLN